VDQLLTTKLYIPQLNVDIVSRPSLCQRLDESLKRKLTLISAPTGFGKSTLVTDWLSKRDQPAAWLSLDQGDNDPVRFWTYLIAAIQTIHPEIGSEARQIISSPQLRRIEPVVIDLINDISKFSHDLIVVLDDYHIIETEQVHNDLGYLFEHQPQNLHIILITRVDPSISLARLRVHGQLIEIRAEDLQFSFEEAAILFNEKMGLNLTPGQIEALNTHTESWVVGLQLAALSMKGKTSYDTFIDQFTGGHKFILDYLIEEVLVTLPDYQRGFMLRTSILERFCGALCRVVTDDPSSQQILEEIRKSNLFLIPLDTEGRWFRYHHLFAEVLYALLEKEHRNEITRLHLKAAIWFESENFPNEAVDYAIRSGDILQVREMFLKHWVTVLHRGEVATVLRWLDALPEEMEKDDPSISLARCWALFLSGQNSTIGLPLEKAKHAYEKLVKEKGDDDLQQNQIAAQIAMMQSVLARNRGDHIESVAHAEMAAGLIPEEMMEGIGTALNMLAAARAGMGDFEGAIEAYGRGIKLAYASGNLVGAYMCTYGQIMYMLIQGRLNDAEDLCRSSIERAVSEGHGEFPAAGSLYITMARIQLERYRLDEAEAYLETGLRIARPGGFGEAERSGRYLRVHLLAASGDLEAAMETIKSTARIVNAMDEPYQTGELNYEWVKLCIKAGDLDTAREKLQVLEEKTLITQHANLLLWRGWVLPRLLCAEERYEEALKALEEPIHRARSAHSNGALILLLALHALALQALGDRNTAREALHEGLALGAPGGYIWFWLSAGAGIKPLLRDFRSDGSTPQALRPYLESLLGACEVASEGSNSPQPGNLPDQLTLRELEILRLISKGYSNLEIANILVVTTNTIKKHTSNIYGKLGVSSRTQAIARFHDTDLT